MDGEAEVAEGQTQEAEGGSTSQLFGMGDQGHTSESAPTEEPQTEEPAAPEPVAWDQQPLPEGHPYASKYKTLGDFSKAYEASSAEGRRLAQETRDYNARLQDYDRRLQQLATQAQPAKQAEKDGTFFGFPSQKAFNFAMQEDPQGTMQKLVEYGATNSEKVGGRIEEIVSQRLNQALAPYEEHRVAEMTRAQIGALESRYPLGEPNSPERQACANFLDNTPWFADLQNYLYKHHPGQNVPEVAYKLATYDMLAQKVKALESKVSATRSKADSARPGAGGKSKVKMDGSPESVVAAAAEAVGGDVDPTWIAGMTAALKKYNLFGKKK